MACVEQEVTAEHDHDREEEQRQPANNRIHVCLPVRYAVTRRTSEQGRPLFGRPPDQPIAVLIVKTSGACLRAIRIRVSSVRLGWNIAFITSALTAIEPISASVNVAYPTWRFFSNSGCAVRLTCRVVGAWPL